MERATYRVMKQFKRNGEKQLWQLFRQRTGVSATVWDGTQVRGWDTAEECRNMARDRYSVTEWKRGSGRGSAFWTGEGTLYPSTPID